MKTDRFSPASTRAAAVLLAGLLLAAGLPAAGQTITFKLNFGKRAAPEDPSKETAKALARQVEEVQKTFADDRRALRIVPGPGGEPAYVHQDVTDLIARTEEDLDRAIEQVGDAGLEALRAWSSEEFRHVREGLEESADRTAASPLGLSAPRAVAVVAGLGDLRPVLALANAAALQQATIPAAESDRLLDQVGKVIGRIFFLAAHDDLEVELRVSSTPAQRATFRFWSQGKVKGSAPANATIRTNGKRDRVLRGLYSYRASLDKGAVTESVTYPTAPGAPPAQTPSDRLDLVNGSSFFCCRFDEKYCHHVAGEQECRP